MKVKEFFLIVITKELYEIIKFILKSLHSIKVVATIFICYLMYLSIKEHYAAEVIVPAGLGAISWLFALRKADKVMDAAKAVEAAKAAVEAVGERK